MELGQALETLAMRQEMYLGRPSYPTLNEPMDGAVRLQECCGTARRREEEVFLRCGFQTSQSS